MKPAPGVMLTPSLRLLRVIGEGGMGSVWLAEHSVLRSEVAVKLLSPELTHHPEALERFHREASAIARLKSPHVVKIYDVGDANGTPFFVMERLEGEDLSHRLARTQRLPLGIVTAIVVQTCKALAAVHDLGIVHRDLKPGNIFLSSSEGELTVKLLDFGVAKQSETTAMHATTDGALLGTPLYMSPEQLFSTKDVTPAADLYSLAVVAYECLAGTTPFDADSMAGVHIAIASGHYRPITGLDRSLPPTLDAWFERALSQEPSARFTSAREMAEAFLVAARARMQLPSIPDDVTPPGMAIIHAHPSPRAVGSMIAAAVGFAIVVTAISFGFARARRTESAPSPAVGLVADPPASVSAAPPPPAPSFIPLESPSASATPSARRPPSRPRRGF
jgi:serine/threonine-protein kinase